LRSDRGPLILEVNSSPGFGIEKVTKHDVAKVLSNISNKMLGATKDEIESALSSSAYAIIN